ncbi:MAG TPA: hypothetical protein VKN18_07865 [Blastocatellia bacterium]|jgi:hypothetical protein|nr:hypothetical protein [Blastocatellia bacterium]
MAQIVLISAANGEPQKISMLGQRPPQWCQENLKLDPDPIALGTRIELTRSQQVFVKVDQGEKGPLQPGMYPSDRIPAAVRELLREL